MDCELFARSLLRLDTECDCQLKQIRTFPSPLSAGADISTAHWEGGCGWGRGEVKWAGNSNDSGLGQLRRSVFMSSETRKVSPPATLLMAPQDVRLQGLLCEGHAASGDNCVNKSRKYRHSWLGHKHHPQRFTSKNECQSNTRLTLVTIGKWVSSGSLRFRENTKLLF